MEKSERALVIISNLSTKKNPKFRALYRFLEQSGVSLANLLGIKYALKTVLIGSEATSEKFVKALKDSAVAPIKEIDVILNLHGLKRKLYFNNEVRVETNELRDNIKALNIGKKLRMLYSTACFGASHGQDFVDAGFTCVSGAKGINTNTIIEYPSFLTMWATGFKFSECINASESLQTSAFFDKIARPSFPNYVVNSDKDIFGKPHASINSI